MFDLPTYSIKLSVDYIAYGLYFKKFKLMGKTEWKILNAYIDFDF